MYIFIEVVVVTLNRIHKIPFICLTYILIANNDCFQLNNLALESFDINMLQ